MMNQNQLVQDEMRKLIKRSCESDQFLNPHYYSFQKSLLKFFFNCAAVTIDPSEGQLSLYRGDILDQSPGKMYDLNEASTIKISFENLEETLKGCLESSERATRFYRSMLFHYNNVGDVTSDSEITAYA
ncbi:MAG: hypothetical protein CMC08_01390 [Flavobacteriaceae bacterium]|nr:hypothetical protein [Flavobacteriaceae bacterium]|tara:strand:+ start:311 stop:697 length:387 start_codon:yes stop_codon:yes gene_type:complete